MGMARPLLASTSVAALLFCAPASAGAQSTMNLSEALARARQTSPLIIGARMAIEESRARLLGAGLRSQTNPELEVALGRRNSLGNSTVDLDIAATQMFEPAGRRPARLSAATAAVDRSAAQLDEITREVLRDVASAFYQVLHAEQRIALLTTAETLTATIHQSAERRYKAGDIAVLDVNLAKSAQARVRADRSAAEADRIAAMGRLRQLLGLDAEVRLQADLTSLPPIDRAALNAGAARRPELRELESAIRGADADVAFSRTFSRPEVGLGASFRREEGDQIVGGSLKLTLPFFSKGQELLAVSTTRASRLRGELDAARARIRIEIDTAVEAYIRRRDAVMVLTSEALPGLDENGQLATRSFDSGQIGLPDLLLIRREMLETRFQYVDALIEAALARVELDAVLGVLR
jgi:cobalt-zinc-cadmium efflux system outer membrane protein